MKSKFVAILCIIALFIPTYIAVFAYVSDQKAPVDVKSIDRVEISDLNQQVFKYTAGTAGKSDMIDFILELNSNATTVSALPDQLMGSPFFKISFFDGNKEVVYKYYFSLTANESYYLDDKGNVFRIKDEDAKKFIDTECALSLYSSSAPPVLYASDTNAVTPKTIVWNYKNSSGTYITASNIKTEATVISYDMIGSIDIDFAKQPDTLAAKIYKGGELIYDGLYGELTGLSINEKTAFNILLEAKWFQDSNRDYYGTATYEFVANIAAPASFYLGKTSMEPGEFTVLTGINVTDISKIKFTSEPALTYGSKTFTPVFYSDGKYVRALIPTTYENTAASYVLTMEYGATKQNITLNMKPRTFGTSTVTPSNDLLKATRTAEKISAFEKAVAPVVSVGDSTRYWEGKFIEAVKNGTITLGYGRYRTITTTKEVYRHTGVDYSAAVGTDVLAVNNGKVVYTGVLDYTGNIVVVEHGYGLKSWYCHLSKINVAVGDTVTKGSVIGKSGNTGFTVNAAVHVGLSVFDFPVCQYAVWEEEIAMYKD